jgi:type VI secretion system secreted protein Hcp
MADGIFLNFLAGSGSSLKPAFTGESVAQGHVGEISAQALTWGYNQHLNIGSQSAGVGAGKVEFGSLTFTKGIDSTSPSIYLALASGTAFPKVVITMQKQGIDYLVFTLGLAAFSSIQGSATAGSDPTEVIGLEYGSVLWQLNANTKKSGNPTSSGWNVVTNHAVTS